MKFVERRHLLYIRYTITVFLAVLLFIFLTGQYNHYSAANDDTDRIFSDGRGKFYRFFSDTESTIVEQIEYNNTKRIFYQSVPSDSALVTGGNMVIVRSSGSRLILFTAVKNSIDHLVSFNDLLPKKNCIASDSSHTYYITDERNPSAVIICSKDGAEVKNCELSSEVRFLFSDTEGNTVFAACENGIYDIREEKWISCPVPEGEICFNNRFCTDSSGNVYELTPEDGFVLLGNYPYQHISVTEDGKIYAAVDNIIYLLDDHGKAAYSYTTENEITRLTASGQIIAVCDSELLLLRQSDFQQIYAPAEESSEVNLPDPEVDVSDPEQSVQEWDGTVSSDLYQIEDGIISNIPEKTTVTALISHLDWGEGEVIIRNASQKQMTSGKIGTGWTVQIISGQQDCIFFTAVRGDLTGEGNVNSNDVKKLSGYLFQNAELTKYEQAAADWNGSGSVELKDLYEIYCSY